MNHKQFIEKFKDKTFYRKDAPGEFFKFIEYEVLTEGRGNLKVLTSLTKIEKLVINEDWKDIFEVYNKPLCHCNNCNTTSIFSYENSETRSEISYDIYKCSNCNSLVWNYVESIDDVVVKNKN